MNRAQRIFSFSLCVALIAWLVAPITPVRAAGEQLLIDPNTSTLTTGGTLTVTVRGYANTTGLQAAGRVVYSGNLVVMNTDPSVGSGSFNGVPSITQGNGGVDFSTGSSKKTGILTIFTITFRAQSAGQATVGFTDGSTLGGDTTIRKNGAFTINAPPTPTPTPTPAPTPAPPTPTPTPTPAPTDPEPTTPTEQPPEDDTTPDTSGLIKDVTTQTTYTTIKINWELNDTNGTSKLLYGTNSDDITKSAPVTKQGVSGFSSTIGELTPGVRYYLIINGTRADGSTGTYSRTVITQGYPVKLSIMQAGAPAAAAKITIGQQTYAATNDGTVSLSLAAGSYNGVITATDGASQTVSFSVVAQAIPAEGTTLKSQNFSFAIPKGEGQNSSGAGLSPLLFLGILVGALAITAVGFLAFVTIRRRRYESFGDTSANAQTAIVIEDGYNWESHPAPPSVSRPQASPTQNHNSVYIEDEEPVDMFDAAPPLPPHETPIPERHQTNLTSHPR